MREEDCQTVSDVRDFGAQACPTEWTDQSCSTQDLTYTSTSNT